MEARKRLAEYTYRSDEQEPPGTHACMHTCASQHAKHASAGSHAQGQGCTLSSSAYRHALPSCMNHHLHGRYRMRKHTPLGVVPWIKEVGAAALSAPTHAPGISFDPRVRVGCTHAELAAARQERAAAGQAVAQGVWVSRASEDAQVYLDSVKASQREADAVGQGVLHEPEGGGASAAASGPPSQAMTASSEPSPPSSQLPSPGSANGASKGGDWSAAAAEAPAPVAAAPAAAVEEEDPLGELD